ncbi:MAG: thiamine phosphate synthase, partial [Bryobacteraceae bacterium]
MVYPLPRLYPILDSRTARNRGLPSIDVARAMLSGGARILQFRHKEQWTRDVFSDAEQIAGLCRAAAVPFVVNDRVDMAALLDAGIHLGQEDLL